MKITGWNIQREGRMCIVLVCLHLLTSQVSDWVCLLLFTTSQVREVRGLHHPLAQSHRLQGRPAPPRGQRSTSHFNLSKILGFDVWHNYNCQAQVQVQAPGQVQVKKSRKETLLNVKPYNDRIVYKSHFNLSKILGFDVWHKYNCQAQVQVQAPG